MNTLTSKCKIKKYFQCNKQHSKSNDAKVKKAIPFSQTNNVNQTTSFKATFKLPKAPKVHLDRTRYIILADA